MFFLLIIILQQSQCFELVKPISSIVSIRLIATDKLIHQIAQGSKRTYYKYIKELHQKSYIFCKPSFNPYEKTEVLLLDLSDLLNIENADATSLNNEASSLFDPRESNNELTNPDTRLKNERTKSENSEVDKQVYIDNNKTNINTIKHIDIP